MPNFSSTRALWLAPLALALAACSDTGPKASQPVSLSVTTKPSSSPSADIMIGSGANSLTISQAQIVLARIELSPSGACATTGEEDDCDELEVGPTLVSLPVDGSTQVVLDGVVSPGTYRALEAKLDAVTADDDEAGASAFLTAHPDFQGVSVMVMGAFTDANSVAHAFTFTSEVDAEIEAMFQPPVTVDAGTSNLTIAVDVASWFTDATGAAIDPTNAANAEVINRNIENSFRAFEDDNRDGGDDHKE
ncbi:MAG TPA: hypothetical protein VEM13_12295 [Gemmatimonadales bacterium]|nr:hypothetical protein [Gemmatimonadales bacterium]